MQSFEDHLLSCIGEECGETSQVVGKSHRFGTFDSKHEGSDTNAARMRHEVHDIIATYKMYCDEIGVPFQIDANLLHAKYQRVYKHMLLSYLNDRLNIDGHIRQIYMNLPEGMLPREIKLVLSAYAEHPTKWQIGELLRLCYERKDEVHEWVISSLYKLQDAQ